MKRISIVFLTFFVFLAWLGLNFFLLKNAENKILHSDPKNSTQHVIDKVMDENSNLSYETLQLLLDRCLKGELETHLLIQKSFKGITYSILSLSIMNSIVFWIFGIYCHKKWYERDGRS